MISIDDIFSINRDELEKINCPLCADKNFLRMLLKTAIDWIGKLFNCGPVMVIITQKNEI